jgi:enamine deaminase RidA (YjgF/YER057c/UK114 family)
VLPLVLLGAAAWSQPPATPRPAPPFSPARAAGDFIYLSGALPTGADGGLVAGDVKAQTARALDNLASVLRANGASLDRAASVTVYLRHAADFGAMNEVYARYWPKDPPVRTTVMAPPVLPAALVEISLVAIRDGAERTIVHPDGWLRSPSPYSYGIKSGSTLFLAGLIARRARDNSFGGGDMKAQTVAALANGREILAAAGFSLADVVSSRVFITDVALFQDMNAVYREAFPASPPARATVRCGLMGQDYLVEISMVAVRDPGRRVITTPAADGSPGTPNPVLSPAIQVGSRLYLSGMLGSTPATRGDAGAQTKETLARLGRTLQAAGFDWKNVVEAMVYLPDGSDFAAMNEAYRGALPQPYPARTTVEAGLVAPDGLVEIMMVAVK